jgi:hypothetical protein
MKNIHTLKKQAQRASAWRGHRMHWIPAISHGEQRELQTGVCRYCDATVHLNTRPLPNEIDIGGEAVALNCTREA